MIQNILDSGQRGIGLSVHEDRQLNCHKSLPFVGQTCCRSIQ